jgi:putative DNA-invertase from lambdoid prophage Rac
LAGIFAEPGISGSVPFAQREQGAALLSTARKGDVIVCLKLDRAFRDSLDALGTLEALQKRGVGLYLRDMNGDVTENSVSKLVFSLLSATASFERARIGERISDAKKYQRDQGRFMGGPHVPFGFAKEARNGRSYLVPVEPIHTEARTMKADRVSLRRAAEHFKSLGHSVSHSGVAALYKAL